ncbi:F0F1 ATP synthase subunit alpha [Candidatus Saccharibacteria bacterium]|nr:F0F1 ATP synthase subunit alpha [Candidatus Saccharibacteria bacterium]
MSDLRVQELTAELQAAIGGLSATGDFSQIGVVTRVGDGVAWIYGLRSAGFSEVVSIETAGGVAEAFVLSLGEDELGAVLLGNESAVSAGAKVKLTGRLLSIPVGPELMGRVVDPLGRPLDGLGDIKTTRTAPVEQVAPGVMARKSVHEPMATGIIAIDTMVPIGRGQRELIIGDRGTGKTAIAIDTMLNQAKRDTGVINIYVAIGQKNSKVAALVERLKREGAMDQSIVVATSPADPASLLYLAPYAGTAIGEYFRDNKQHGLIVYDDLSKHAVAYRQLSLLLRRPPGREAYPGDVFYLHSRLLERSAKLSDELGGGSLTALPIIETQAGDVSAYIPTNVISITDGQIFLETDLFYQGIRPAISVGLSVSRVGGDAQTKAIKSVAGSLRIELAQFRELAAFSQFATDLDDETKSRLDRGRLLTEALKQRQFAPYSPAEQVVILSAAASGEFDNLPSKHLESAIHGLLRSVKKSHAKLVTNLNAGTKPTEDETKAIATIAKATAETFMVGEDANG